MILVDTDPRRNHYFYEFSVAVRTLLFRARGMAPTTLARYADQAIPIEPKQGICEITEPKTAQRP